MGPVEVLCDGDGVIAPHPLVWTDKQTENTSRRTSYAGGNNSAPTIRMKMETNLPKVGNEVQVSYEHLYLDLGKKHTKDTKD